MTTDTTRRLLRPVALNELDELERRHQADQHSCVMPTKVMVKNGQTVGAVSLGAVCLVLPWFDTQTCKPRDSIWFIREMERHLAATLPAEHPKIICVPFVPQSKFHPHVARLGYQSVGLVDLTFKTLR